MPSDLLFWKIDARLNPGFVIALVRAWDHAEACQMLEVDRHSPAVAECTTPALLAATTGSLPGDVVCMVVERLPSAYDRFGFRDRPLTKADYDEMEAQGYDVR